jgi:hypothetical protein
MEPVSSKNRIVLSNSNPLLNSSILEIIFGYVGPGHWLFLATLSKSCKESYLSIQQRRIHFWDEDRHIYVTVCGTSHITLTSAAFSSSSCFRLAVEHGMQLPSNNSRRQQRIAGEHSSLETLKVALQLGLNMTDAVVQGAAESGSLAKLNWLHTEHGCQFNADTVFAAAKTGQLDICKFLVADHGCPLLQRACYIAISRDYTELLNWLREQGCPWDHRDYCISASVYGSVQVMA